MNQKGTKLTSGAYLAWEVWMLRSSKLISIYNVDRAPDAMTSVGFIMSVVGEYSDKPADLERICYIVF